MKYGPCLSFCSLPSHPEQVHAFTIQVLPDRRMEAVILCASSRRSGRVPFSMTSDRIRRLHSVPVAIRVKTENQPSFKQIRGAFQMYRFDQWKTKHENNCALHPYEKKREQWKKVLKCPHKVTDTCTLQFLYPERMVRSVSPSGLCSTDVLPLPVVPWVSRIDGLDLKRLNFNHHSGYPSFFVKAHFARLHPRKLWRLL